MRKQISYSKWTLRILVLAVALVQGGCAVLTVDVDMYKGPLANEETVIAEQIKAEIIGAKSLLFTLRNKLEESNGDNPYLKKYEFMPIPTDHHEQKTMWLKNPDAIRVNAILGLYEDSPTYIRDEVTRSYLDKLKVHIDRFRTIKILMNPNAKDDRLFWDKYAKHLYLTKDHHTIKALPNNIDEITKHDTLKSLEEGLELMQRGYRELLYPDYPTEPNDSNNRSYRNLSTIAEAHDKIRESYIKIQKLSPEVRARFLSWQGNCASLDKMVKTITRSQAFPKYEDPNKYKYPNKKPKYLTNESFDRLQDSDLVRAHVDFLFKDSLKEAQRREFIERVNLIARKFRECRVALDKSFRTSLELIEYVNSKNVEETEINSLLTKSAIKLALATVKNEALRAAFLNRHVPPGTKSLKTKLSRILPPKMVSPKVAWNNNMIGPYKKALLKLFEENPLAISRLLHDTHLSFIDGPCEYRSNTKIRSKYKFASGRRFGLLLVHPVGEDIQQVLSSSAVLLELQTGAGLDHGRLPKGLETLIDNYLILVRDQSAKPTAGQQKILDKKRTVLTEALIRFAEKGLVIANYDTLLRGNGDSKKKDKKKYKEDEKKIGQYTDVLQAIGNSIIVMANELKMKASYKSKLEDGWRREVEALEQVFSKDSPANISRSSKSSKEVLDDLIALLRHEYVLQTKKLGKESNEAKWVGEALDVAYQQRANMVYVRPASAYLRSSYPATSLQRDPSVAGWRNMLGRHARRSIPFCAEKTENKSESDLETLRDIDKQSWQNINHVRVAGTGFTSYVVVKDDIGNWYIKGYKGDPESIIKGARNMALFAASAQTGQNLTKLQEPSKSNDSSPEPPQMRQLRKYNTEYQQQLEKDYDKLQKEVRDLHDRIASNWDVSVSNTNGFKDELKDKALKTPNENLVATVKKISKRTGKDKKYMEMYTDILSAVIEYRDDIALRLGEPTDYEAYRVEAVKTARRSMTNILSGFLTPFIELRETASRKQETVLMIISDTGE